MIGDAAAVMRELRYWLPAAGRGAAAGFFYWLVIDEAVRGGGEAVWVRLVVGIMAGLGLQVARRLQQQA